MSPHVPPARPTPPGHDGSPDLRTALASLPIVEIHPDEDQPRKLFQPTQLVELVEEIRALGHLENPLHVYWHAVKCRWTIKHGERRWRALAILVREGGEAADRYARAPVIIVPPADTTLDGQVRNRIAQIIENNGRRNLTPLETGIQMLWLAGTGSQGPLSATEVGRRLAMEERTAQRHLSAAAALTPSEQEQMLNEYGDVALKPLYALAKWLTRQGPTLSPEMRQAAIDRFVTERPTHSMVAICLQHLAAPRRGGRPARKRFAAEFTPAGNFRVEATIPAHDLGDPAAIRRGIADLEAARQKLASRLSEPDARPAAAPGEGGPLEMM